MGYIFLVIGLLVFIYLILIMPKTFKKQDDSSLRNVFYAHRGFHDNESDAPENSMKAFEAAVERGYGIELDVQLTKDDVLVVFHDDTLDRMCGVSGKVREFTFEQLQALTLAQSDEKIPTLKEVLNLVNGKIPLIVEIKMSTADALVCEVTNEVLSEYKGVYCIESFHPFAVQWYRKNRPDVIRGQLSSNLNKDMTHKKFSYFIMQHLLTNITTKPDFIAYCHTYQNGISRTICKKLYRSLSVAWTIKSQAELDASRDHFDLFIFEGFVPDEK